MNLPPKAVYNIHMLVDMILADNKDITYKCALFNLISTLTYYNFSFDELKILITHLALLSIEELTTIRKILMINPNNEINPNSEITLHNLRKMISA